MKRKAVVREGEIKKRERRRGMKETAAHKDRRARVCEGVRK